MCLLMMTMAVLVVASREARQIQAWMMGWEGGWWCGDSNETDGGRDDDVRVRMRHTAARRSYGRGIVGNLCFASSSFLLFLSCCVWVWHAGVGYSTLGLQRCITCLQHLSLSDRVFPQPGTVPPNHPSPAVVDLLLLPRPRRRYLEHRSPQIEMDPTEATPLVDTWPA